LYIYPIEIPSENKIIKPKLLIDYRDNQAILQLTKRPLLVFFVKKKEGRWYSRKIFDNYDSFLLFLSLLKDDVKILKIERIISTSEGGVRNFNNKKIVISPVAKCILENGSYSLVPFSHNKRPMPYDEVIPYAKFGTSRGFMNISFLLDLLPEKIQALVKAIV